MKLSYTSIAGIPFCDYLTVTMPAHSLEPLKKSLSELFDATGLSTFDDGITYQIDTKPGALKLKSNTRYLTLSASGGILEHFRQTGFYNEYIAILSEYPLKITRLDATADYLVSYAPDVLNLYKKAAMASKLGLTRKELAQRDIKYFMGQNEHGHETGTVYLGNRETHSIYGKIYDKGFERYSKGYENNAQIVRIELTLKADTGVSLRDAHSPENVFYNYASRSLVIPPPHFVGWEPNTSGYTLQKQQDLFTPAGKILNIFKFSQDVGRAFRLAISVFDGDALDVLKQQLTTAFLLRQLSKIQ